MAILSYIQSLITIMKNGIDVGYFIYSHHSFKNKKITHYFENYHKHVTIYNDGTGVIINEFDMVFNRQEKTFLKRGLDISDGKKDASFPTLIEMRKTKIQDRFSKYGFWYCSDDNIISSVKEKYWTDEDDEDDKGSARKKLFSGSHKNKDDEDYDSDSRTNDKKPLGRKVVPLKTGGSRGLEVVVIRPESMEDSSEITDTLLSGKAVVLNLEGIHVEIAQRIIYSSAGSCYAMRGNLQKITNYIFLVTPPNVDISGDIPELVAGGIDLSTFNSSDNKF